MKRFGVRFLWHSDPVPHAFLKQQALYFDELTVCAYPYGLKTDPKEFGRALDTGLLRLIDVKALKPAGSPDLPVTARRQLKALSDVLSYTLRGEINDYGMDILTRMGGVSLQVMNGGAQYLPIVTEYPKIQHPDAREAQMIRAVIDQFPAVSSSVSWDQIAEFKGDADSTAKFLALRNWINETTASDMSLAHAQEKLEYLLSEYERHMALHKMKFEKSTLQLLVTTTLEIVENAMKLNLSDVAKKLFSFSDAKTALLEAELGAHGREVAYISKIKSRLA